MNNENTRKLFREAMAYLSAAVNIITTDGPGGRRGFTASAVCSVWLPNLSTLPSSI